MKRFVFIALLFIILLSCDVFAFFDSGLYYKVDLSLDVSSGKLEKNNISLDFLLSPKKDIFTEHFQNYYYEIRNSQKDLLFKNKFFFPEKKYVDSFDCFFSDDCVQGSSELDISYKTIYIRYVPAGNFIFVKDSEGSELLNIDLEKEGFSHNSLSDNSCTYFDVSSLSDCSDDEPVVLGLMKSSRSNKNSGEVNLNSRDDMVIGFTDDEMVAVYENKIDSYASEKDVYVLFNEKENDGVVTVKFNKDYDGKVLLNNFDAENYDVFVEYPENSLSTNMKKNLVVIQSNNKEGLSRVVIGANNNLFFNYEDVSSLPNIKVSQGNKLYDFNPSELSFYD